VDRMPRGAILTPLGRNLAEVAAGIDDLMATASRKVRLRTDFDLLSHNPA